MILQIHFFKTSKRKFLMKQIFFSLYLIIIDDERALNKLQIILLVGEADFLNTS